MMKKAEGCSFFQNVKRFFIRKKMQDEGGIVNPEAKLQDAQDQQNSTDAGRDSSLQLVDLDTIGPSVKVNSEMIKSKITSRPQNQRAPTANYLLKMQQQSADLFADETVVIHQSSSPSSSLKRNVAAVPMHFKEDKLPGESSSATKCAEKETKRLARPDTRPKSPKNNPTCNAILTVHSEKVMEEKTDMNAFEAEVVNIPEKSGSNNLLQSVPSETKSEMLKKSHTDDVQDTVTDSKKSDSKKKHSDKSRVVGEVSENPQKEVPQPFPFTSTVEVSSDVPANAAVSDMNEINAKVPEKSSRKHSFGLEKITKNLAKKLSLDREEPVKGSSSPVVMETGNDSSARPVLMGIADDGINSDDLEDVMIAAAVKEVSSDDKKEVEEWPKMVAGNGEKDDKSIVQTVDVDHNGGPEKLNESQLNDTVVDMNKNISARSKFSNKVAPTNDKAIVVTRCSFQEISSSVKEDSESRSTHESVLKHAGSNCSQESREVKASSSENKSSFSDRGSQKAAGDVDRVALQRPGTSVNWDEVGKTKKEKPSKAEDMSELARIRGRVKKNLDAAVEVDKNTPAVVVDGIISASSADLARQASVSKDENCNDDFKVVKDKVIPSSGRFTASRPEIQVAENPAEVAPEKSSSRRVTMSAACLEKDFSETPSKKLPLGSSKSSSITVAKPSVVVPVKSKSFAAKPSDPVVGSLVSSKQASDDNADTVVNAPKLSASAVNGFSTNSNDKTAKVLLAKAFPSVSTKSALLLPSPMMKETKQGTAVTAGKIIEKPTTEKIAPVQNVKPSGNDKEISTSTTTAALHSETPQSQSKSLQHGSERGSVRDLVMKLQTEPVG